ncbi:MAG: YhbY family RNA-binding protein [Clostridia bacterium]|nr:YhbY family RNA-binding protein [Clostridia bacterium]
MISSKDRAYLKRVISVESPVYQVGKDGLNQTNIDGINQALTARELIKINILQNCDMSAKEVANVLQETLNCETVGVIGRKVIIYKFNPKNKTHILNNK